MLKSGALTDHFFRRAPFFYTFLQSFFEEMERRDLEGRKVLQDLKLAEILRAARQTPYYRKQGLSDSIEGWPLIEKEHLRDRPEEFAGRAIAVSPAATGGTTGIPLRLRRSWRSVVAEQVAIDLFVRKSGLDLTKAKVAVLRGDTVKESADDKPPFWVTRSAGQRLVFSSNHLKATTVPYYLEKLREFGPDVLSVYPSALEALCGVLGPGKTAIPNLKIVFSSSEVLRPDIRERAESVLNAAILDQYGQAERVNLALSARAGEFFFQPAYGLTELRFVGGGDDHDYYEILGTSLWNTAQFLVRYRTGDLAVLPKGASAAEIEKICLGFKPFLGIAGRSSEYVETPAGERIIGINQIPRGLLGVVQMQFIQRARDRVDIYVIPQADLSPSLREQILRQTRTKIPPSVELIVHEAERLERTASGKIPLLIREIERSSLNS
jgi:phenylacetate-CoA ligase